MAHSPPAHASTINSCTPSALALSAPSATHHTSGPLRPDARSAAVPSSALRPSVTIAAATTATITGATVRNTDSTAATCP